MSHLTFEQISDLVDAAVGADTADLRHVADCAECRTKLERVRALVSDAHALPRDVDPPAEVWTALNARVARERVGRSVTAQRWWHNGRLAAAAAIVLIVGTATLTSLVIGGRNAKAKAFQTATRPTVVTTPPALLAVDGNYGGTIRGLRASLDSQSTRLSPATIRTLERSLAVIDAAIAEARDALTHDPANVTLVDILAAHYEQKVDLLQRATQLPASL